MISQHEKDFVLHVTTKMINEFIRSIEHYESDHYFIIVASIVTSVVATIGNGLSKKVSKNKREMNDHVLTFFDLVMRTAREQKATQYDETNINQEIH